jgi:Mevalonate kinase
MSKYRSQYFHTTCVSIRSRCMPENYGERYVVLPGSAEHVRHPLLEAAINEVPLPDNVALEITIFSDVPAGASTGTSAAVTVALIGALDALTPAG